MTQEEAIKILKDFHDKSALFSVRTALETLHLELKESEDEKLRKDLLQIAKESEDSFYMVMTPDKREQLIAWLEKQGEVESDNDDIEVEEKGIREAFNKIEDEKQCKQKPQRMISAEAKEAMYAKSAEWSEEDEKIFNKIIQKLDKSDNVSHYDYADFEIWLIDLKERLINI